MVKLNNSKLLTLLDQKLINEVYYLATVDSTNKFLESKPFGQKANICVAETQTNGIGRRGNNWQSAGKNITFSVQWQFSLKPQQLTSLAIVVSIICAKTLQENNFKAIKLKWPNDLIYQNKKLGGVLVEQHYQNSKSQAVIGIGINAKITSATKIDQEWIDLTSINPKFCRLQLTADIINNLLPVLNNFHNQTTLQDYWQKYDWHKESEVTITSKKQKIIGVAKGINTDGALILLTSQGKQIFYSGEVSLRKI